MVLNHKSLATFRSQKLIEKLFLHYLKTSKQFISFAINLSLAKFKSTRNNFFNPESGYVLRSKTYFENELTILVDRNALLLG